MEETIMSDNDIEEEDEDANDFVMDMQRHTTLTMTNHYASLTVQQLHKSHEKYSPLRAEKGTSGEVFGEGYWETE